MTWELDAQWRALVALSVFCLATILVQFGTLSWLKARYQRSPKVVTPHALAPPRLRLLALEWRFLAAYWVGWYADWLNGPYLYTRFVEGGYSHGGVVYLLITGYITSAVVGPVMGFAADRFGRKKGCLGYCLFYTLAALLYTTQYTICHVAGRLCDGIATSLCHAAFESWIAAEVKREAATDVAYTGQVAHRLARIYQLASAGSSVSAIIAGVVASAIVTTRLGLNGPSYLSAAHLVVCGVLILWLWDENVSMASGSSPERDLVARLKQVFSTPKLWLTGSIQSLFEAAMFSFVYIWSASLPAVVDRGVAFAIFMSCVLLGGGLAAALRWAQMAPALSVALYLCGGALSLLWASLTPRAAWGQRLIAFSCFEIACGMHFTAFYLLRGHYVLPDKGRSTILTIFRVPLNLLVVLLCTAGAHVELSCTLQVDCALLAIAAIAALGVHFTLRAPKATNAPHNVGRPLQVTLA